MRFPLIVAALVTVMALPLPALASEPTPSSPGSEFARLLNKERTNRGLPVVKESTVLTKISADYAAENMRLGGFDHSRDKPYTDRAIAAGCSIYSYSGPVLAQGYNTPAEALQGWLDSDGHRAVLLDRANTHVGAAFQGGFVVAFVLNCTPSSAAATPPRTFTPSSLSDVGALRLTSRRPSAKGRTISQRVRVRAGRGKISLAARLGKRHVRGRQVSVAKRTRAYRLAVRVSRPGRWKVTLSVNRHVARRFTVRVRKHR